MRKHSVKPISKSEIAIVICSNRLKKPRVNFYKFNSVKLVFVSQGDKRRYESADVQSTDSHLVIFHDDHVGVSNAKNLAIKYLLRDKKIKLVLFTDDDCLPNKNWVDEVLKSFSSNEQIDLLFGQTKAYQQHKHPSQHCFSAFKKVTNKPLELGATHWREVGYSNNMAVRINVFRKIGLFKSWLGPGSLGEAAEDAEFIIRSQIAGIRISYNEKMIVYHDKWLKNEEVGNQKRVYSVGGIAAYAFYYFQGVTEYKKPLGKQIKMSHTRMLSEIKKIIKYTSRKHTILLLKEVYSLCKGIVLGAVFAHFIPISEEENVVKNFYNKTM